MPKKVTAAQRRSQQVTFRVTSVDHDVLDAAAHLERRTVNDYVYGVISAHVHALLTNDHVLADLENRRSYDRGRIDSIFKSTAVVELNLGSGDERSTERTTR